MSGPITLAARLAQAVGVPLTHGDAAVVEAVERLRRERDDLEARDALSLASEVERLREQRDEAIGEANALRAERESIYAGSPAADGRAVQALLDAHGYPLREFGPVVRVMRLLGIQGVDLAGDEGGDR